MKLWEKGYSLDQTVEKFMTGDDPLLDQQLIIYDCLGSIAHAKMLERIGILTPDENAKLTQALGEIIVQSAKGEFTIHAEDEDVHTAIENALTRQLGEIGKKLHTARSRNDQVLVDVRLYLKDQMRELAEIMLWTTKTLCLFAETHKAIPIPGRTHFQRAMPSSLGLWAGAFAESLLDDLHLLKGAYELVDQCPLGSAASYGVSLPIDRQLCADLLGFSKVQNNVLYANNSRGKFEAAVLHVLAQIMNDMAKISTDVILFSTPEFGYLTLPEKFCPGSSLMPQKRNPCPLELIRAKSATVQSLLFQVLEIIRALPSGYNRDFQETKRPLMLGFEITVSSLTVFSQILADLQVNPEICKKAFSPELFATDQVLLLASQGMPFRDAYQKVAKELPQLANEDPVENILSKTHQGSTGKLNLDFSQQRMLNFVEWLENERRIWKNVQHKLLED